ncbi:GntR family transcriptional regulator [uncultured Friedmanniella sp.]|uniref:GntR family transcriptional regulator n=1 Tax=uncultured Friedmanniella sp. TaxID=335381 RepID=UPI0035CC216C
MTTRGSLDGPAAPAQALPLLSGASTLPSMLFDLLEEAIITGMLEPGGRIHADDLATHYGISRIPIREALRSLHEAGWVDIKPRYGVRVRERTEQELTELFEFRALVEGHVARWAAERRTDADLTLLERTVRAGEKAQRSRDHVAVISSSNSAFYDTLTTAAHNSVLKTTAVGLRKRARFYFSTVEDQLGSDWIEVHRSLAQAVREAQPDHAARIAAAHIVETGAAVRGLLFHPAAP